MRSRLYFKAAKATDGDKANPDLRELSVRKNNYGPTGEIVRMVWRAACSCRSARRRPSSAPPPSRRPRKYFSICCADSPNRAANVSDKKGTTFAPAIFAEEVEATEAKVSKADLAEAMKRLFASQPDQGRQRGSAIANADPDRRGWKRSG